MATTLDSAEKRLQEAQKSARSRATREAVGPDWPKVEGMTLEEAVLELSLKVLVHGVKVSLGNTPGTADIWCRVSWPLDSEDELAGQVIFTTSSTVERVLRKAGQLFQPAARKYWQPDRFAK